MCGIAGYIGDHSSETHIDSVRSICSHLQHRGPDSTEIIPAGTVCFGHTRLSIIDLNEEANQPMWNNDQSVLLVLNGEIYNFKALKNELSFYSFKTLSDTEVVLAAYQKWGLDFVHHLEGMFSLALHDMNKQQTVLIRDRFGKKPLYYAQTSKGLWFSSEVRSLLKAQIVPPTINKAVLGYYLQFQSVHFPETIIKDINMLPPGAMMHFENGTSQIKSYYKQEEQGHQAKDINYNKEIFRELFYNSVEKRLVSDVPLAVLLSAGIDSNLILAAASSIKKVDAFTIGFTEKDFDESELASISAKAFGAKHHVTRLSENDFLHAVNNTLVAMDHPSGDGPNTFVVSEQIKKAGFTVALSGLGGDEIFYGYPHYTRYEQFQTSLLFNTLPKFVFRILDQCFHNNQFKKLNALKSIINDPVKSMAVFRSNFDEKLMLKVFGLPYATFDSSEIKETVPNSISITEMNYYMHDTLLRDADQMSMAHSIELRNPFLDQNLVAYMRSLKNKQIRPPKQILLDAFSQDLPLEILNKKKSGFTFPWDKWMRGALYDFCKAQMLFLEGTALFKTGSIYMIWNSFDKGSKIYTWSRVWPLVCLSFYIQENNLEY